MVWLISHYGCYKVNIFLKFSFSLMFFSIKIFFMVVKKRGKKPQMREKKEPYVVLEDTGCQYLCKNAQWENAIYKIYIYKGESKVLHYFGNVSHNSAALDDLLRLWRWQTTLYCDMSCSPDTLSATHWICLYGWEHSLGIHSFKPNWYCLSIRVLGGARGVMVIIVEKGHGDTSSNPGRDWLHFT